MLQGVVVPKSSEWVQKRPAFYGRWQQGSLRALCVKGNKYARARTRTHTHARTDAAPSLDALTTSRFAGRRSAWATCW